MRRARARLAALRLAGSVVGTLTGTAPLLAQDAGDTPFGAEDTIEGLRRVPGTDLPVDQTLARPRIRANGFELSPVLQSHLLADSNPRARPDGPAGVSLVVEPRVDVLRRSRGLAANAYGFARVRRFISPTTENTQEYGAGLDVQRQVNRSLAIRARGEAGHYAEPRFAAFAADNALTPVEYTRFTGQLTAAFTSGRFAVTPSVEVDRLIYFDNRLADRPSIVLDQGDRTFTRTAGRLTVGTAGPAGVTALAGVEVNGRDYDEVRTFDPDSSGILLFGGVRLRPDPLVELEVVAGYLHQSYQPPFGSPSGVYGRAEARWTPTPLTRLTVDLRRDVSERGNLTQGGALRTRARVTFDYRARRDLLLEARLDARAFDVAEVVVDDFRTDASAGVSWRSAPGLELFARGRYLLSRFGVSDRDGAILPVADSRTVDQAQLLAGVRFVP